MDILFFRGLNSSGDETLRTGPFRLGSYDQNLRLSLGRLGIRCFRVEGLDLGSVEEMAENAIQWFHKNKSELGPKIHLVGHSTGGLVARVFAHLLGEDERTKIQRITTIASPNQGSEFAGQMLKRSQSNRWTRFWFRRVGCTPDRLSFLNPLLPPAVEELNRNFPQLPNVTYDSIRCAVSTEGCTRPVYWFRKIFQAPLESDGFVELSSQGYGLQHSPLQLDHLQSLGYFTGLNRFQLPGAKAEYERLVELIHQPPSHPELSE